MTLMQYWLPCSAKIRRTKLVRDAAEPLLHLLGRRQRVPGVAQLGGSLEPRIFQPMCLSSVEAMKLFFLSAGVACIRCNVVEHVLPIILLLLTLRRSGTTSRRASRQRWQLQIPLGFVA